MASVVVRGDGVAACCCAHLLRVAGCQVAMQRVDRPRLPALLISEAALALIRDVFGRPELFSGIPRIRRRVVAWTGRQEPVTVDHRAIVISERALLEGLEEGVVLEDQHTDAAADWVIYAARPLPEATVERRFGSRTASAARVELIPGEAGAACWIESLEDGWLFLLPGEAASGWLLRVGAAGGKSLDGMLARSRVIAKQIAGVGAWTGEFPAYPRIVSPLCGRVSGAGWLACGTAAMAFDPICGDGVAYAIREAILAAAIIRAALGGGKTNELLAHYEARLSAGFRRHLGLCRDFYSTGYGGNWWDAELKEIERDAAWCSLEEQGPAEFRYRLRGFEVEARA